MLPHPGVSRIDDAGDLGDSYQIVQGPGYVAIRYAMKNMLSGLQGTEAAAAAKKQKARAGVIQLSVFWPVYCRKTTRNLHISVDV